MKRIYIAGPLTPRGRRLDTQHPAIEYLLNVRDMIRASVECLRKGWAPFCPALDMLYFLNSDHVITESEIKDVGLAFIPVCDAILIMNDGAMSPGVYDEFILAQDHEIAVYRGISQVPNIKVYDEIGPI